MKDGFVPQNAYNGLAPIDYHFARMILIRARAEKKALTDAKWPLAKTAAKSRPVYPEVMRSVAGLRDRIVRLANVHNNRGPGDGMQIALFSMGGFLSYRAAEGSTHPGGTTCVSSARGVYHAAGIDLIGPSTPEDGRVIGFLSQFENIKSTYVDWRGKDAKPTHLQPGDVFHIQGEMKEYDVKVKEGDKTAVVHRSEGSTHVGIITVGGEPWTTVEGGGSGHVTKEHTRNLIPASSPTKGKWRFGNDDYVGKNAKGEIIQRPVVGYVDVSKVGKVMALDPTPLPPAR